MKIVLQTFIGIIFSLSAFGKVTPQPKAKYQGKVFKHKVSQTVDQIIDAPSEQENKHIQVKGKIKKVCPMAGCWIDLESPKTGKTIHVKVKDGDIVFPKTSVGKTAVIEGVLFQKKMSKEKAIKFYRHRAKELGIPFDPSKITGPTSTWEIKGTSAKVDL